MSSMRNVTAIFVYLSVLIICFFNYFTKKSITDLVVSVEVVMAVMAMVFIVMLVVMMVLFVDDWHLDMVLVWNWDLFVDRYLYFRVDWIWLINGDLNFVWYGFFNCIRDLLLNGVRLWYWYFDVNWVWLVNINLVRFVNRNLGIFFCLIFFRFFVVCLKEDTHLNFIRNFLFYNDWVWFFYFNWVWFWYFNWIWFIDWYLNFIGNFLDNFVWFWNWYFNLKENL